LELPIISGNSIEREEVQAVVQFQKLLSSYVICKNVYIKIYKPVLLALSTECTYCGSRENTMLVSIFEPIQNRCWKFYIKHPAELNRRKKGS
jgi:hypothetical protein